MVRVEGLEPPRLAAPEPKSGASAISPHPHPFALKKAAQRRVLTQYAPKAKGNLSYQMPQNRWYDVWNIAGDQTGPKDRAAFGMNQDGGSARRL